MNQKRTITTDACDYVVELHHSGDVIWVYDHTGARIADAERDTAVEQVFVHYSDADGQIDDASTEAPRELYDLDWNAGLEKLAAWLISTHPEHA